MKKVSAAVAIVLSIVFTIAIMVLTIAWQVQCDEYMLANPEATYVPVGGCRVLTARECAGLCVDTYPLRHLSGGLCQSVHYWGYQAFHLCGQGQGFCDDRCYGKLCHPLLLQ